MVYYNLETQKDLCRIISGQFLALILRASVLKGEHVISLLAHQIILETF